MALVPKSSLFIPLGAAFGFACTRMASCVWFGCRTAIGWARPLGDKAISSMVGQALRFFGTTGSGALFNDGMGAQQHGKIPLHRTS